MTLVTCAPIDPPPCIFVGLCNSSVFTIISNDINDSNAKAKITLQHFFPDSSLVLSLLCLVFSCLNLCSQPYSNFVFLVDGDTITVWVKVVGLRLGGEGFA